ncbi:hypothetical protein HAX54_013366, partial [Datura stramonium]|nr:hypothetical protein [Datura stramonium]
MKGAIFSSLFLVHRSIFQRIDWIPLWSVRLVADESVRVDSIAEVRDGTVSRNLCSAFTTVTRWEGLAAHLNSSEGARYVRGTKLRLCDSLCATLRIIIRHPSSSEAPRQVRGTELMLRNTLRATLPVYSKKFLT